VNVSRAVAALFLAFLSLFAAQSAAADTATPIPHSPSSSGAAPTLRADDVYELEFASFAAEYFLERDDAGLAHLRVVETITARFPAEDTNRGFYRDIPKFYKERPMNPTVSSVTDEHGKPVPFAVEDYVSGDGLDYKYASIALGDDTYVHGTHTYVIEYTLDNVIAYFEDSQLDEFYWDVNGVDTGIAIGEVSVTVHVAPDLVSALTGDTACYPGTYSSLDGCALTRSDETQGAGGATFSASVPEMSSYDTLTIDIGFAPKTFTIADRVQDHWVFRILPPAMLGLAVLGLVLALVLRFGVWRDARGRGIVIAQYTAPEDHDLVLAADLIGKGHDALAAAFVNLAVRGFVDIVDLAPAKSSNDNDFVLEYRSKDGATPQELKLLKTLFDGLDDVGERVRLESIDEARGAELYALGLRARDRSVSAGLRAQPKPGAATWIKRITWVVLAGLAASFIWTITVGIDGGALFGWLIACIAVFFITGLVLTRPYLLTNKGAEQRDYLLGIRDYLTLAEEDRIRVLQSPRGAERAPTTDHAAVVELNEKLLPYAVLWGVEREWARELEVEYAAANSRPTWINAEWSSLDLSRAIRTFSDTSTSRVRPIVPVATTSSGGSSWSGGSSSSFSGFSSGGGGGGFSGGGGGGGGMRGR
jgi:uncharacterized protein (TIGR04222 family)